VRSAARTTGSWGPRGPRGTDRWPGSEFFRYRITELRLVGG
jgi:hypothetical protein